MINSEIKMKSSSLCAQNRQKVNVSCCLHACYNDAEKK